MRFCFYYPATGATVQIGGIGASSSKNPQSKRKSWFSGKTIVAYRTYHPDEPVPLDEMSPKAPVFQCRTLSAVERIFHTPEV